MKGREGKGGRGKEEEGRERSNLQAKILVTCPGDTNEMI